jgi:hypothetical protein
MATMTVRRRLPRPQGEVDALMAEWERLEVEMREVVG